jgi:hypothetical protein
MVKSCGGRWKNSRERSRRSRAIIPSTVVLQLNEYAATRGYSKYNLVEPVIKSKNMTIEELGREPRKASQKFFMHK